MPRPRKIAYEEFAEFAASDLSLAESYRRTTGQTKNADVKGTQWHGYAGIKERIAELKDQNARRAQLTRDELLAFYAEVIRTPADQVSAGSPSHSGLRAGRRGSREGSRLRQSRGRRSVGSNVQLELGGAPRDWRQYTQWLSTRASSPALWWRAGVAA
jgi:hypothetical protein